ncbi:MAG: type II toxin-antitoxin system PemK/MazF family toxin [Anaerolineales bacterium]|nr:type II toxin-antitoxin system PemK/MazF family toxin [Anaerolineales bacterium]
MVINQGDVFWIDLGEPLGSEPGYERPCVVIQNNVFNLSQIHTVVVCLITSNLKRGSAPGNVTLNEGEANLSKASVALVTQVFTVDKNQLGEYIGTLSQKRIRQILDGLGLVTEPREIE